MPVDELVCGNPRSSRIEMLSPDELASTTYVGMYWRRDKPNQQTKLRKRDGELEKPGGLSSRCSPQHSVPDAGAADPRAQAFAFLGMRSRKQGRAGVGAWRDAKMTICSQKKTVRSRRHKALNWLFCLADA